MSVFKVLEKQVEQGGDEFMAKLGFTSIHFSQARASKQTPGIPDRRYYNPARGVSAWFEAKREGRRQTKDQREFQQLAESCGEVYLLGTTEVLIAWCQDGCPMLEPRQRQWWPEWRDRYQPQQFRFKPPKRKALSA